MDCCIFFTNHRMEACIVLLEEYVYVDYINIYELDMS